MSQKTITSDRKRSSIGVFFDTSIDLKKLKLELLEKGYDVSNMDDVIQILIDNFRS